MQVVEIPSICHKGLFPKVGGDVQGLLIVWRKETGDQHDLSSPKFLYLCKRENDTLVSLGATFHGSLKESPTIHQKTAKHSFKKVYIIL